MAGLQGGQRRTAQMPSHLMVEIARDPEKFDSRIAEYQVAREAALEAKQSAEAAKREADEVLALVRTESSELEKRRAEHEKVVADWHAKADQEAGALEAERERLAEAQARLKTDQATMAKAMRDSDARGKKQNAEMSRQAEANAEIGKRLEEISRQLEARAANVSAREQNAAELAAALRAYLAKAGVNLDATHA
jgi:chromosome segregation ATPase